MADTATAPALTLRRAAWSEIEERIAELDNPECSAEWYRREVAGGKLHVLAADAGGEVVAGALVRIDSADWGLEFVLVAACGGVPGRDLVAELLPQLEMLARLAGCASLRCHTARPGLAVKMERAGYAGVETVYRKRFNHERAEQRGTEPTRARDAGGVSGTLDGGIRRGR